MTSENKKNKSTSKQKKGGQISRQTLYSIAQSYSREAIETLASMMRSAKQESVRMAASKTLLDKALPDLKAMEVSGRDGENLKLVVSIVEEKKNEYPVTDSQLSSSTADI